MQLYLEKINTLIQDALLPLAKLHLLLLLDSNQFREQQPAPGWEESKSQSDFPTEWLRCSLQEHLNQRSSSIIAPLTAIYPSLSTMFCPGSNRTSQVLKYKQVQDPDHRNLLASYDLISHTIIAEAETSVSTQ